MDIESVCDLNQVHILLFAFSSDILIFKHLKEVRIKKLHG